MERAECIAERPFEASCAIRLPGVGALFVSTMLVRTRPARPAGFIEPCLPSPAERPPTGPGWVHEIKHDGFRMMVRHRSRRYCGMPWSACSSTSTWSTRTGGRLPPRLHLGHEGIVSKRLGSPYRSGRSPDWLKMKNPDAPAVKPRGGGGLGEGEVALVALRC